LISEIGGESDFSPLRRGRVHEFADRREDGGDGLIVFGELFIESRLELRESSGRLPEGGRGDNIAEPSGL